MRGEPDLPGGGIDSAQYNNDRWFELFIERDTEAGMRAGLPLHRRQTVHFPTGDMTVNETFKWEVK